jgi:hypothetical protein
MASIVRFGTGIQVMYEDMKFRGPCLNQNRIQESLCAEAHDINVQTSAIEYPSILNISC